MEIKGHYNPDKLRFEFVMGGDAFYITNELIRKEPDEVINKIWNLRVEYSKRTLTTEA